MSTSENGTQREGGVRRRYRVPQRARSQRIHDRPRDIEVGVERLTYQLVQSLVETEPVLLLYFPVSHASHAVCSDSLWYFPLSQVLHSSPVLTAYDPASQSVQEDDPFVATAPVSQSVQDGALLESVYVPIYEVGHVCV